MSKKEELSTWDNLDHWQDIRDKSVEERFSKPKITISAKTDNQQLYINSIKDKSITIVSGPSGSGKTYIAVGLALQMLNSGKISKIIVSRPMVECGRKFGAMPGDLDEKFVIYMRPILDNFLCFVKEKDLEHLRKEGKIEFVPLELMRGASIKDSFVFVDEAQNLSKEQMLMFLTRIGEGSKFVVSGDIKQSDLKIHDRSYNNDDSALAFAARNLEDEEIGKVYFTSADIVRHGLVKVIIEQWETGR